MIKAMVGISLIALTMPAHARTFCCDTNGRMYCDEGVPVACQGKPYREVNNRGVVVKHYEAPLTPEQVAKREAEAAKKREEERRIAEEERKNRMLLSLYSSTKDIDLARDRAIADIEKLKKQSEQKLEEVEKRKKQLANESEFYKKGIPESLKSQMRENEADLKAQQKNVAARVQEMEAARVRFEEEKRRYILLTSGEKPAETKSADSKVAAENPRSR